jgi:hypothetical protein
MIRPWLNLIGDGTQFIGPKGFALCSRLPAVSGLGLRFYRSGSRAESSGLIVYGLGVRVRVQGQGLGLRVLG